MKSNSLTFLEFFKRVWRYIHTHITPILTYLRTSLQNQTKREGYEKDDLVLEVGYSNFNEF